MLRAGLHFHDGHLVVLGATRRGQDPGFDIFNGTDHLLVVCESQIVCESQSSRKQITLLQITLLVGQ